MSDIEVVLELPEELVKQAQEAGILTGERVSAWLKMELERKWAIAELREDARKLRALKPDITSEEIQEEINAVRKERDTL